MRAARASRRSNPRAPSTTFAPRSASRRAVASPIPLLAPVITTTLPSILFSTALYLSNPSAPSFFKQELAHFSNDQRFVYYEHVVVSVMQFDDSRVLDARAEALDCAFYPLRERLDVAIEFLLLGMERLVRHRVYFFFAYLSHGFNSHGCISYRKF